MADNFDLMATALKAVCPNNEILLDNAGKPSVMVRIPKMTYFMVSVLLDFCDDDENAADAADRWVALGPALGNLISLHEVLGQVTRWAEVDNVGVCLGYADVGVEVEGLQKVGQRHCGFLR